MQELTLKLKGALPSNKNASIGQLIISDTAYIKRQVADTGDRFHVVAGIVSGVLAMLSLIAIIVTWMAYIHEGKSWPDFGWWFVAALVLFFGCTILSIVRDKTPLMQDQEGVRLERRSADDPRLRAARVIDKAISVWETVCHQYCRVYKVVNGQLDVRGNAVADECHSFLAESHPVIERAIEYFYLKDEFLPPDDTRPLSPHDPGYLAHEEKLRQIIAKGEDVYFKRHLVMAAYDAPLPTALDLVPEPA